LFFGEISKIRDGKLYNQMRGSSDYLTVGVSAGSYTFQSPNTQSYKDAEKLWIDDWGNVNLVTESQLIGKDFANTIVKYENLKGKRAVYNGTSLLMEIRME